MFQFFKKNDISAGKKNLIRGMVVRKDGWTSNSYQMWLNLITIYTYKQV